MHAHQLLPRLPAAALALALALALAAPAFAATPPRERQHDSDAWFAAGARAAAALRARSGDTARARNLVLFVGDGMGVSTVTAARILAGQRAGGPGEDHVLAMESLPEAALVRTWSVDAQVADSAPTATALLSGVKTRRGMLGVGPETARGACGDAETRLASLFHLAEQAGLATGIVTTARLTHATPAAAYAHASVRDWESDGELPAAAREAGCPDIARQFLDFDAGDGIDLALGGGRQAFLPATGADPEHPAIHGNRRGDDDLMRAWRQRHRDGALVTDRAGLLAIGADHAGPVLGLFEPSHMRFELDRDDDRAGEPSLAEMTAFALDRLSGDEDGYLLLVEAGRIDHAHHHGNAARALEDTLALDRAVAVALARTSRADTLVLVTADHGHTLSIVGYPGRGNPILGHAGREGRSFRDARGQPYPTLAYANGPGWRAHQGDQGLEPDHPDYLQTAGVPLADETHGGEDVPAFAAGPGASALRGVLEQHVLFHLMLQAMPALVAPLCERGLCEDGVPLRRPRPGDAASP